MNCKKEYVINQIRGTKKIIPPEVRKLAALALEEMVINLEDFREIHYFLDMNNGLCTCRAWNTLLYRTCKTGLLPK